MWISFHSSMFVLEAIFSPVYAFDSFAKILVAVWVYFWVLYSISLASWSVFHASTICFCYYDSICNLRLSIMILLELFFFFAMNYFVSLEYSVLLYKF